MARKTKCTTVAGAGDGGGLGSSTAAIIETIALAVIALTAAVAALAAGGFTPPTLIALGFAVFTASTFVIATIDAARTYFFDKRLICLSGEQCAIAQVVTIEDDADGDRSLNTILAPANELTLEGDYRAMSQPAALVYVDPGLATRGWRLEPSANRIELTPKTFGAGLPFFHCEIEGTAFDDWTLALLAYAWAMLAVGAAAMVLGGIGAALGWIGWVLIAIVFLFVFLASLFAGRGDTDIGSTSTGPLGDATPGPNGPIITDTGGNTINVGDTVALLGRHVCDTGHNPTCWDELHAVTAIAKIPRADYDSAPAVHVAGDILDKYCAALGAFKDANGTVKSGLTCLEHPAVG